MLKVINIKKSFSYKIFKKAETYIIPTISYNKRSKFPIEKIAPPFFNKTLSINYLENTKDEIEKINKKSYTLIKLIFDVCPDFKNLEKILNNLKKQNLLYLRLKTKDYICVEKLVEKEKEFNNLILTVENKKLTEKELIDLYEEINFPMKIGFNTKNIRNFRPSEKESSIRKYFKEMFKFYKQLKIIEIDFEDLNTLFRHNKEYDQKMEKLFYDYKKFYQNNGTFEIKNDEEDERGFFRKVYDKFVNLENKDKIEDKIKFKTANFQTLIDFTLLSEFKGFIDISLLNVENQGTKFQEDLIKIKLEFFRDILKKNGFYEYEVETKRELHHIFYDMPSFNTIVTE